LPNVLVGLYVGQFDSRVVVFKNSKYLIGKGLSDGFDSVEIENNRLEFIDPCKQPFRL